MDIELLHRPGSAVAKMHLEPGESFTAEGGAMIAMSSDMRIETTTHQRGKGGIGKALKRMLAGESFFLNHYTSGAKGGDVWLGTTLAGDMIQLTLDGQPLIVQGGSFVACEEGIDVGIGWQGVSSVFAGEGLFWLELRGRGKVVLSSFGAIYPIEVDGAYIVDTGHIVAFPETLGFKLSKAGKSWMSSILGGEGLVCRFEGRGTAWCQSHSANAFGRVLGPLLRPR